MLAKQLSVFLENKSGRLTEVTDVLGEAGVNLSAMSIADNSDFGILRCIVSDPDKAYQVLKAAHFAVKITDVIGFVCPNTMVSLSSICIRLPMAMWLMSLFVLPTWRVASESWLRRRWS